jgi:hypothetical protein
MRSCSAAEISAFPAGGKRLDNSSNVKVYYHKYSNVKGHMPMKKCELIEKCIFFNDQMANMTATVLVYKKLFCQQDSSKCARYTVFKAIGRENVPSDLFPNQMFPNQMDRAEMIIGG